MNELAGSADYEKALVYRIDVGRSEPQETIRLRGQPAPFEELGALFDHLRDGVVSLAANGTIRYQNAAYRRMVHDEIEPDRLSRAVLEIALGAVDLPLSPTGRVEIPSLTAPAHAVAVRECRTISAVYRVRAAQASPALLGASGGAVVVVERCGSGALTDALLRARYKLTTREIEVARLLATGARGADIAAAIGTSVHTARRHTERVLGKLGLHARAQVGAMLRGEAEAGRVWDAPARLRSAGE